MSITKRDVILASMAPSNGRPYTPVQIQKLLFINDNEANIAGGPHFAFEPYSYGPFDKDVYNELEAMQLDGLATVARNGSTRMFALTPVGQARGLNILDSLPKQTSRYLKDVSAFVLRLDFAELVSAVYRKYPEMRVNSVFRG